MLNIIKAAASILSRTLCTPMLQPLSKFVCFDVLLDKNPGFDCCLVIGKQKKKCINNFLTYLKYCTFNIYFTTIRETL